MFSVSEDGLAVMSDTGGELTVHRTYTRVGPAAAFAEVGNAVLNGADIDPGYDPAPTHHIPNGVMAGYWA